MILTIRKNGRALIVPGVIRFFAGFIFFYIKDFLNILFPGANLKQNKDLAQRLECSPMARETWVQSQVESYQRL